MENWKKTKELAINVVTVGGKKYTLETVLDGFWNISCDGVLLHSLASQHVSGYLVALGAIEAASADNYWRTFVRLGGSAE